MTRRLFLMAGRRKSESMPVDPERCNAFAGAFNAYAGALARGVADMRLWRVVVERWDALVDRRVDVCLSTADLSADQSSRA